MNVSKAAKIWLDYHQLNSKKTPCAQIHSSNQADHLAPLTKITNPFRQSNSKSMICLKRRCREIQERILSQFL